MKYLSIIALIGSTLLTCSRSYTVQQDLLALQNDEVLGNDRGFLWTEADTYIKTAPLFDLYFVNGNSIRLDSTYKIKVSKKGNYIYIEDRDKQFRALIGTDQFNFRIDDGRSNKSIHEVRDTIIETGDINLYASMWYDLDGNGGNEKLIKQQIFDGTWERMWSNLITNYSSRYKADNVFAYLHNYYIGSGYNYLATVSEANRIKSFFENLPPDDDRKQFFTHFVEQFKNSIEYSQAQTDQVSVGYGELCDSLLDVPSVSIGQFINDKDNSFKVLLLNEDHGTGNQRLAALEIVKVLQSEGKLYVGLEALNPFIDYYDYSFPIQDFGLYLSDPEYGNFIRYLLSNTNIELVAYEAQEMCPSNIDCLNFREQQQQDNIMKAFPHLKIDGARLFVYGGTGHIGLTSSDTTKWKPLGMRLSKIFGVENIVSVDQLKYKSLGNYMPNRDSKKCDLVDGPLTLIESPSPYVTHHLVGTPKGNEYQQTSVSSDFIPVNLFDKYKYNSLQVFYENEFDSVNFRAIPVVNRVVEGVPNYLQFALQPGQYICVYSNEFRNLIYMKKFVVE